MQLRTESVQQREQRVSEAPEALVGVQQPPGMHRAQGGDGKIGALGL